MWVGGENLYVIADKEFPVAVVNSVDFGRVLSEQNLNRIEPIESAKKKTNNQSLSLFSPSKFWFSNERNLKFR